MRATRGNRGMALAVVLMAMAILVALVVEFAQGVHMNSDHLVNWHKLQQLSLAADSGVSVAMKGIEMARRREEVISYSQSLPYAVDEDSLLVSISAEDVTARFNINRIVNNKGKLDDKYFPAFLRMLEYLETNTEAAELIADWIDEDWESGQPSRNAPLESVEEILQIPGIDNETYAKLRPYITVHGSGMINVNLAEAPVLASISQYIDTERILQDREDGYYSENDKPVDLGAAGSDAERLTITYSSNIYRVVSTVETTDGLERTIECVLNEAGGVLHWRES
jgi:general secretion pathway protein K